MHPAEYSTSMTRFPCQLGNSSDTIKWPMKIWDHQRCLRLSKNGKISLTKNFKCLNPPTSHWWCTGRLSQLMRTRVGTRPLSSWKVTGKLPRWHIICLIERIAMRVIPFQWVSKDQWPGVPLLMLVVTVPMIWTTHYSSSLIRICLICKRNTLCP